MPIEQHSMLCTLFKELHGEMIMYVYVHANFLCTCIPNICTCTVHNVHNPIHVYSRSGAGVNVTKTLDLLKAVMQSSFNQEVKKLCDDYFQVNVHVIVNVHHLHYVQVQCTLYEKLGKTFSACIAIKICVHVCIVCTSCTVTCTCMFRTCMFHTLCMDFRCMDFR